MLVQPKELEGVLLVDKPTDHTSHDVIARLRGILKMRRIGHAGTLDPMATGVLVVLLGKATKASQYLMSLDKEYTGTIKLGSVTNTQDAEGEVLESRPVPPLTEAEVKATMATFVGDQYQLPPMFSAIKIDGVPLYKQARKGEEVEREPRFIRVASFDMTRFASPEIDFVLRCTKGTYVRTVAHDLGQKIGCGAHLSSLRRTATGKFTISQCLTIEQIQALPIPELERRLVPGARRCPEYCAVNAARQIEGLDQARLPARPLHLAIGMFDGVHLGHRAVIDSAIQSARRSGGLAGVLTFWPHPSALFNPQAATRLIAGPDVRSQLLAETGVDFVITQPFTPQFAAIEAEWVLPYLKKSLPTLSSVYVGENWRFGQGRRGDIAMLVTEGKKLHVGVVSAQRINHNGEPISSTRIRGCLESGAIEEANELFGYTYFADGVVAAGKKLGRTIGFPTLNIPWEPSLRPRFGVYAVRVKGPKSNGEFLPAVANYGLRPTVEKSNQPRIEAHLLVDCPFGEGDDVRVEWLHFIRSEKKFSSISALTDQIGSDRREAAAFFGF